MSFVVRLLSEEVRSLAFGSIAAGYTGVGTVLNHPARMIVIQNFTDAPVMFSFDGVTDHLPLVANGYMILDVTANKTRESGFFLSEGDRLYVKQLTGAPTTGSVYFTVFYGKNI